MGGNQVTDTETRRTVADNWECADSLEKFKQKIIDPLQGRMDKNHIFLFQGGYEKQCEKNKVKPDYEYVDKLKKLYEENVALLSAYVDVYLATLTLIARHEATINELARVYVGFRDKVLWKDKIPSNLMPEQQEFIDEYFESIQKILEPCKLDE